MVGFDNESIISRLGQIGDSLEDLSAGIGALALFVMMVLITINAISRYFFNSPQAGVYTGTERYLMVALVFLVMPALQRREGNIKVDILSRNFSRRRLRWVRIVSRFPTLLIFAVVTYAAAQNAIEAYSRAWVSTGVVQFPQYLSWVIVTIGIGLFCLRLAFQVAQDLWVLRE